MPIEPVTKWQVENIELTDADTEYSVVLPSSARQFRFRCREASVLRYAYETGKVATETNPYLSLPANADYQSDANDITGLTIYFASSDAGVTVEMEIWK